MWMDTAPKVSHGEIIFWPPAHEFLSLVGSIAIHFKHINMLLYILNVVINEYCFYKLQI